MACTIKRQIQGLKNTRETKARVKGEGFHSITVNDRLYKQKILHLILLGI